MSLTSHHRIGLALYRKVLYCTAMTSQAFHIRHGDSPSMERISTPRETSSVETRTHLHAVERQSAIFQTCTRVKIGNQQGANEADDTVLLPA